MWKLDFCEIEARWDSIARCELDFCEIEAVRDSIACNELAYREIEAHEAAIALSELKRGLCGIISSHKALLVLSL